MQGAQNVCPQGITRGSEYKDKQMGQSRESEKVPTGMGFRFGVGACLEERNVQGRRRDDPCQKEVVLTRARGYEWHVLCNGISVEIDGACAC